MQQRQSRYEQALASGRAALGTFCCLDGFSTSHLLAAEGMDFLVLDKQHAAYDIETLETLCWRIRSAGAAAFIRTASCTDTAELNLVVDLPIDGILAPNIDSLEAAEAVIRTCLMPPRGERSVGNVRNATLAGLDFRDLPDPMIGLLIEHVDAVNAIEEIAALPGVSFLFVGPHDLAASMGISAITEPDRPPEIEAALERVRAAACANGVTYWTWSPEPAGVQREVDAGADAVMWGLDALIFRSAIREFLDGIRLDARV